MRHVFVLFIILWSGIATAQSQEAIPEIIQNQLNAFAQDDFERAFSYASPYLQQKFQNPQIFRDMVTTGYPMVWRYKSVTFGSLEQNGERWVQTLDIVDMSNQVFEVEYHLTAIDGEWRISAVFVRKGKAGFV